MRILSVTALVLAVLAMSGAPAPLQAKPARTQPDPQVFDLTEPSKATPKSSAQQDCYVEPEGFHKQIRWDEMCLQARKQRQHSTQSSEPSRFMPRPGPKNQVNWD